MGQGGANAAVGENRGRGCPVCCPVSESGQAAGAAARGGVTNGTGTWEFCPGASWEQPVS